jgi:hypothetical protein
MRAKGDARQDHGSESYEAAFRNQHWTLADDRLVHYQTVTWIQTVPDIGDVDLVTEHAATPKLDTIDAMKLAFWANITIVADEQMWREMLFKVTGDWLQQAVSANNDPVADFDAVGVYRTQRHHDASRQADVCEIARAEQSPTVRAKCATEPRASANLCSKTIH